MNHIDDILSALGAHIGISDLMINDDHVCRLVLDKMLVIDIEYLADPNVVQVYAAVGRDPGDHVLLYRKLLSANLFGQGTGGAVLALDEQREELMLTQAFDLTTTTPEKFITSLDVFTGYAEAWTAELLDLEELNPLDEKPGPSDSANAEEFIRV